MVPTLALGISRAAPPPRSYSGGLQVQGLRPGPVSVRAAARACSTAFSSPCCSPISCSSCHRPVRRQGLLAFEPRAANVSVADGVRALPGGCVRAEPVHGRCVDHDRRGTRSGYVLKRNGFGPAPIIMGIVLGGLVETSLTQSMIIFDQQMVGVSEPAHRGWRCLLLARRQHCRAAITQRFSPGS